MVMTKEKILHKHMKPQPIQMPITVIHLPMYLVLINLHLQAQKTVNQKVHLKAKMFTRRPHLPPIPVEQKHLSQTHLQAQKLLIQSHPCQVLNHA